MSMCILVILTAVIIETGRKVTTLLLRFACCTKLCSC